MFALVNLFHLPYPWKIIEVFFDSLIMVLYQSKRQWNSPPPPPPSL